MSIGVNITGHHHKLVHMADIGTRIHADRVVLFDLTTSATIFSCIFFAITELNSSAMVEDRYDTLPRPLSAYFAICPAMNASNLARSFRVF